MDFNFRHPVCAGLPSDSWALARVFMGLSVVCLIGTRCSVVGAVVTWRHSNGVFGIELSIRWTAMPIASSVDDRPIFGFRWAKEKQLTHYSWWSAGERCKQSDNLTDVYFLFRPPIFFFFNNRFGLVERSNWMNFLTDFVLMKKNKNEEFRTYFLHQLNCGIELLQFERDTWAVWIWWASVGSYRQFKCLCMWCTSTSIFVYIWTSYECMWNNLMRDFPAQWINLVLSTLRENDPQISW